MKYRSSGLKSRALSEALIKSCGFIDEELERPLIAVINTWNELHPGHVLLRGIADAVKAGIRMAGGTPFESNTIALCDGIRTPESLNYILPSREIIADSIELVTETFRADAVVLISSCDKIEPACLMGAARVNLPAVFVTGGPMMVGIFRGRRITGVDMDVAGSGFRDGRRIDEAERAELVENMCLTPGGCFGMGTANTMACLIEALGLSLPGSSCLHAVESAKLRCAKRSGIAAVELVKKGVRLSDIVTERSIYNAMVVNEAIGGSTNTFLHMPAFARELGLSLPIEEFDRISSTTPQLCEIIPSGPYDLMDLRNAGGIPAVMKELAPLLDLTQKTVTGKTLAENIEHAVNYDTKVIHPLGDAVRPHGSHAVLKGNLAPAGAVVKQVAVPQGMLSHAGPARIYESCEDAIEAIRNRALNKGDVLVIRYEGPKGGPGMREMVDITRTLSSMNLEDDIAIVTDGRFSGYSRGAVIGHVSPEAQEGGPIALLEDGDIIRYDIPAKALSVDLAENELKRRRARWRPRELALKGYLGRYSRQVSSSSSGAVVE